MAVPVTVVVITKNEASRIEECLKSVAGWAEEIVVVDDESSDETRQIASAYTDKVFTRKMDIEGKHRNYAYSLADNEWILSLDADERATPELMDEIEALLKTAPTANGYNIARRNYIGNYWVRYGGWYPSAQLKLFKKSEFRYEEVEVHPRAFMGGECGNLKSDIIHCSYRDIEDFLIKLNNQTTREAQKQARAEKKMGFSRSLRRTIDRFWRSLVGKKGYKDGSWGFILAVFAGFYQILTFAKLWEMLLDKNQPMVQKTQAGSTMQNNERQAITAVLIVKNEEEKIRNCLESIKWVDEIVVVDGMSTDKTVDICNEYGAKVIQHEFEGDFGLERNIGIDNSSGDWIVQLDADEIVTEAFKKKVMEVLSCPTEFVAYKFRRKNFFLGRPMKYGGWYHYSLHFFKKGFARYKGRVHHELIVNGKIGTLEEEIEHYPFKDIETFIARHNRYTTYEAIEMYEQKGSMLDKKLRKKLIFRPLKIFRKLYIKKKGFLEGMHGFIFAVLFSWVDFSRWAKYWEICKNDEKL